MAVSALGGGMTDSSQGPAEAWTTAVGMDEVAFRLLGPLEIRLGDRPMAVTASQERALLALLLTTPGRVWPVTEIVAGLWGDDRPPRAGKTVQAYVSRLRRALGPDGAHLIVTRAPGYLVAVSPDSVDAVRFAGLAEAGHRSLAAGRYADALDRLRAALELWRGDALVEFNAPFAKRERVRLGEQRLTALEERVAAELALGAGAQLVGELESLVGAHPLRERLWEHLITALYRAGRQADALEAYQRVRAKLVDELGIEPGQQLRALERMVLGQDPELGRAAELVGRAAEAIPPSRDSLAASRDRLMTAVLHLQRSRQRRLPTREGPDTGTLVCPYKGLMSYDADDAGYFFGRDRLVAELVTRLVGARMVAVIGPSGSGKSSAVRAGLLPGLAAGTLPGSQAWTTAMCTPTQGLPGPATGRTVLVVDQFEEVFTALDAPARARLVEELSGEMRPDSGTTCVIIIRADYYGHCATLPGIAELLAENTVLVAPMNTDELRTAIEGPAGRAGLTLESGLADALLADVADQPGAMPLLSTSLLSLWEQREGSRLTLAGYLRTGGVREAIGRLAESAYARLTDRERAATRRILLRLAEVDGEGRLVRRRAPIAEVAPDGDGEARRVLDILAAHRLVSVNGHSVEVAHEALLREWPRLRGWLDEDEAGRKLRAHLAPAAREWASSGRDPAELYRGGRLATALDWAGDHGNELTEVERDYLAASQAAAQAELRRGRRSIRRLRLLVVGLAAVLAVAVAAGVTAAVQRSRADRAALAADVQALRARASSDQQWDRALLYAAQAQRWESSAESRASLLSTLQRSPEAIGLMRTEGRALDAALSPDGSRLAVADNRGNVTIWDTRTRARQVSFNPLSGFPIMMLDFSADGRMLAAASGAVERSVTITDLGLPEPAPRPLPVQQVLAAAFGPDDDTLIARFADGYIRLLDAASGQVLRTFDGRAPEAGSVAGRYLDTFAHRRYAATGCDEEKQGAAVWDAATGRQVWSAASRACPSIDPTGATIVLGLASGAVQAVDLASGQVRTAASVHTAAVWSVAWAGDGSSFATMSDDRTVAVWDPRTLQPTTVLRGHTGRVTGGTFSPDRRTLYTIGLDKAVFVWDLDDQRRLARPLGPKPASTTVTPLRRISGDGTIAVSLFPDAGLLEVNDLTPEDGPGGYPLAGPDFRFQQAGQVAVDSTGHLAAVLWLDQAGGRLTARMLDIPARQLRPFTIVVDADAGLTAAFAGALSADGHTLTTVDGHGHVRRWDTATGAPRPDFDYQATGDAAFAALGPRDRVLGLVHEHNVELVDTAVRRRLAAIALEPGRLPPAFSPDGRLVAVGSWHGQVMIVDAQTGRKRQEWQAHDGPITSLAFTRDSRFLISGGSDGRAGLWSADTGHAGGALIDVGHSGAAWIHVGVRDERSIITLSQYGPPLLWDIEPASLAARACAIVRRDLTRAEWAELLPHRRYEHTCTR
jgi:DNA-binding SARP family transcriptional activator/WD40 repeat protein